MKILSLITNKRVFFLFLLLLSCNLFSQSSGISIFWDNQIGCQTYFNNDNPRDPKQPVFIEELSDGDCVRYCEESQTNFELSGNLNASYTVTWVINGGG